MLVEFLFQIIDLIARTADDDEITAECQELKDTLTSLGGSIEPPPEP